MQRKICAIGNSSGVSIPKDMLSKLSLHIGDQVDVKISKNTDKIIIEPVTSEADNEIIDKEFASQVTGFINKYRPALDELAK